MEQTTMLPRPIFIIGSPRSGTSILSWCIGQHPNIVVLEETSWIAKLSLGARFAYDVGAGRGKYTHLSANNVDRESFFCDLGCATDGIVQRAAERKLAALRAALRERPPSANREPPALAWLRGADEPKRRWVDGTPYNSSFTWGLHLMFPEAKFIHILRDPRASVLSLAHHDRAGGVSLDYITAARTWYDHTERSALTAQALGSDRVIRIQFEHLVADGEPVLAKILGFVDEPFEANCLRPLARNINTSGVEPGARIPVELEKNEHILRAYALHERLAADDSVPQQPDPDARALLQERFADAKLEA